MEFYFKKDCFPIVDKKPDFEECDSTSTSTVVINIDEKTDEQVKQTVLLSETKSHHDIKETKEKSNNIVQDFQAIDSKLEEITEKQTSEVERKVAKENIAKDARQISKTWSDEGIKLQSKMAEGDLKNANKPAVTFYEEKKELSTNVDQKMPRESELPTEPKIPEMSETSKGPELSEALTKVKKLKKPKIIAKLTIPEVSKTSTEPKTAKIPETPVETKILKVSETLSDVKILKVPETPLKLKAPKIPETTTDLKTPKIIETPAEPKILKVSEISTERKTAKIPQIPAETKILKVSKTLSEVETSKVPETAINLETPKVLETPIEAKTPKIPEIPAELKISIVSETSTEPKTPKISEAPAATKISKVSETPAKVKMPRVSETPTKSKIQKIPETPAEQKMLKVSETPSESKAAKIPEEPTEPKTPTMPVTFAEPKMLKTSKTSAETEKSNMSETPTESKIKPTSAVEGATEQELPKISQNIQIVKQFEKSSVGSEKIEKTVGEKKKVKKAGLAKKVNAKDKKEMVFPLLSTETTDAPDVNLPTLVFTDEQDTSVSKNISEVVTRRTNFMTSDSERVEELKTNDKKRKEKSMSVIKEIGVEATQKPENDLITPGKATDKRKTEKIETPFQEKFFRDVKGTATLKSETISPEHLETTTPSDLYAEQAFESNKKELHHNVKFESRAEENSQIVSKHVLVLDDYEKSSTLDKTSKENIQEKQELMKNVQHETLEELLSGNKDKKKLIEKKISTSKQFEKSSSEATISTELDSTRPSKSDSFIKKTTHNKFATQMLSKPGKEGIENKQLKSREPSSEANITNLVDDFLIEKIKDKNLKNFSETISPFDQEAKQQIFTTEEKMSCAKTEAVSEQCELIMLSIAKEPLSSMSFSSIHAICMPHFSMKVKILLF